MQTLKIKLSELQNILSSDISPVSCQKAKEIVSQLLSNIYVQANSQQSIAETGNGLDMAYLPMLQKLHETQEDLILYKIQNEALLKLLENSYRILDESASMSDKLIQISKK